jgi:hypothetical protein
LLYASVHDCMPTAVAVVTHYVTQLRGATSSSRSHRGAPLWQNVARQLQAVIASVRGECHRR